jgi:hypothetical protein
MTTTSTIIMIRRISLPLLDSSEPTRQCTSSPHQNTSHKNVKGSNFNNSRDGIDRATGGTVVVLVVNVVSNALMGHGNVNGG